MRVQFKAFREPNTEYAQRMLCMYQTHIIPDGAQYAFWNAENDRQDKEDDDTGLPTNSPIQAGLRGDVSVIWLLVILLAKTRWLVSVMGLGALFSTSSLWVACKMGTVRR